VQYHLERERVQHQETKKKVKSLQEELHDTKNSLEKSRAMVDKLKHMLEQAKKENQAALHAAAQAADHFKAETIAEMKVEPKFDPISSLIIPKNQMKSLLHSSVSAPSSAPLQSFSSGSGTITLSNGGPNACDGPHVIKPVHTFLAPPSRPSTSSLFSNISLVSGFAIFYNL